MPFTALSRIIVHVPFLRSQLFYLPVLTWHNSSHNFWLISSHAQVTKVSSSVLNQLLLVINFCPRFQLPMHNYTLHTYHLVATEMCTQALALFPGPCEGKLGGSLGMRLHTQAQVQTLLQTFLKGSRVFYCH